IAPALVHMLAAAIFAFLGFEIAIAATLVYLLYQYLDHASGSESIEDTQIDLVEWLIGLLIGSILVSIG
ncbi:MAG: hypothetical protein N3F67_06350, partial [Acidilobaceae archaeon]|nr:hypothetical protein [Acidilobaceae archaeon]